MWGGLKNPPHKTLDHLYSTASTVVPLSFPVALATVNVDYFFGVGLLAAGLLVLLLTAGAGTL